MDKKPLLCLFFAMAICCVAKPVGAFESWNGEVVKNINLRKLPGLNGEIITGLKKGDKVVISGKHGEWFKIVLERGIYGCKGWVYGEYIKKGDKVEKKQEPFAKRGERKTRLDGLLKARPLEPEIKKKPQERKEPTRKILAGTQVPLDKELNINESHKEGTTEISERSLTKDRLEDKNRAADISFKNPEKRPVDAKPFSIKKTEKKQPRQKDAQESFMNPYNVRMMGLLIRFLPVLLSAVFVSQHDHRNSKNGEMRTATILTRRPCLHVQA